MPHECAMVYNKTFTHNHPGGSIFSTEDIQFTVSNYVKEMRATQPDGGVYSLKRIGTTKSTFPEDYNKHYIKALSKARQQMDEYVPKLAAQGKINQADANRMFALKINDEFIPWLKANAGNYGYKFTHTVGKSGILNKSFKELIHKAKNDPKSKDMVYLDKDTNTKIEKIVNEWFEKAKKLKRG